MTATNYPLRVSASIMKEAKRADRSMFDAVLARSGNHPPRQGDEID
ncbi:MAG: hypothetical protein HQL43_10930 [Alphaproteobacteria bacterium]|nr:hypothetical protein [Alphaproteobacteria bacterium]